MALKIEKYSTNDEVLDEMFFEFKDKRVRKFVNRQLACKGILNYYRHISRYLVNKVKPEVAKELLKKYIIVTIYEYLKDKELLPETLISQHFDEMLENGITIEKLNEEIDNNNLFNHLLNSGIIEFKKVSDKIKLYIREYNLEKFESKSVQNVLNALYNYYDYFQINTNFTEYSKNRKSCDILIAEALTYKRKKEFEFDIIDDDRYMSNILDYQLDRNRELVPQSKDFFKKVYPQRVRNSKIIIGHLVDEILSNNESLSYVKSLDSRELKCYTISTDSSYSGYGINNDTFIKFLEFHSDGYYINPEKIDEFEFVYNRKRYKLTKNGIISL